MAPSFIESANVVPDALGQATEASPRLVPADTDLITGGSRELAVVVVLLPTTRLLSSQARPRSL